MLETMRLTGEMRDKADDCEVWVCICLLYTSDAADE